MTTLADVLAEARNVDLMTGAREARNKLVAGVTATDTILTFAFDLGAIGPGAKLSIGLEDVYVWDANGASKTATVTRGDFGSTASSHAAGDIALVNPIFTDSNILQAVNHELASLSSPSNGLFQVATVDLTNNPAVNGYDLTGVDDLIALMDVRYQAIGPEQDWPSVPRSEWQHGRNLDTGVFPSGQAIFIHGYVDPGRTIRVTYRAPYTPLSALDDDVEYESGLHPEAHDLLSLGAAIRLTAGREIRRNFNEVQGDTRRAQEVPAGANAGANRGLQQLRAIRIREEAARLAAMYPMRVR